MLTSVHISYPNKQQLEAIYTEYLKALLHDSFKAHAMWGSERNLKQLAKSTVQIYEQLKGKFTVDHYSHYVFTPRDISQWILGLLRYDIEVGPDGSADTLLGIWVYQARRLFGDRIVGKENVEKFDSMLLSVIRNDWSVTVENIQSMYYVTWGSTSAVSHTGNIPGSFGRPLGLLSEEDFRGIVNKGLISFGKRRCISIIKNNFSLDLV